MSFPESSRSLQQELALKKASFFPFPCINCGSRQTILINLSFVRCAICRSALPIKMAPKHDREETYICSSLKLAEEMTYFSSDSSMVTGSSTANVTLEKEKMLYFLKEYDLMVMSLHVQIIARYSFPNHIDGFISALNDMHAEKSTEIYKHICTLRSKYCPTGEWLKTDIESMRQHRLIKEQRQFMRDAKRRQEQDLNALEIKQKLEKISRARKVKQGLDPDKKYPPVIVKAPNEIVCLPNEFALVQIKAERAIRYQWYVSGKRILPQSRFLSGSTTDCLKVLKADKSILGTLSCRVSNDDGVLDTNPITLKRAELAFRSLGRVEVSKVIYRIFKCGFSRIAASSSEKIMFWDVEQRLKPISHLSISGIKFASYRCEILLVASRRGEVAFYRFEKGDDSPVYLYRLETEILDISIVNLSAQCNNLIIWGKGDAFISLWDTKKRKIRRKLRLAAAKNNSQSVILAVAYNSCRDLLAVSVVIDGLFSIRLFPLFNGESFVYNQKCCHYKLAWNTEGSHLMGARLGPKYGEVLILNLGNGLLRTRSNVIHKAHIGSIISMEMSNDQRFVITSGVDGYVKIFGVLPHHLECISFRQVHSTGLASILYLDCRQELVTSDYDRILSIWKVEDLREIKLQLRKKENFYAKVIQKKFRCVRDALRVKSIK